MWDFLSIFNQIYTSSNFRTGGYYLLSVYTADAISINSHLADKSIAYLKFIYA